MRKLNGIVAAVGGTAALLAVQSVASASLLVDFTPVTQDTNMSYSGPNAASRSLQVTSPVVTLRSALDVPSLAGPIINGYEVFTNTTISLTGLTTSAVAQTAGGVIAQTLTVGTFTFTSSPTYGSVVLLTGTFAEFDGNGDPANVITGLKNGSTGGFFASTVSYTGGAIYDTLISIPGTTPTGDATFNALLVSPAFNTEMYLGGKYLTAFDARVQGQFSTPSIPEPVSAGLVLPAATLLVRRRRSR